MDGRELLDYACGKFQEEKYDEALEAFILAYTKGYEREWILGNIYSCYVIGNESEFRNAYEKCNTTEISYEDCKIDFVPYRDGEYYIFDKELEMFLGVFSIRKLQKMEPDKIFEQLEFSAASLEMDWNWVKELHVLMEAKDRKVYAVCHDETRAVSFCKIPELENYMKNVVMFTDWEKYQAYFHENTSVYLPGIYYGVEEGQKRFQKILEQEHAYRLTPEGRNGENVLLTIAIPTHNRGNLLLDRLENLLKMGYDAEIEIVVSKNGMDFYEEEYRQASQIKDARLHYVDQGEELVYMVNWRRAVEMSKGKYVLLVSDEDEVIEGALEHYLKLLSTHPEVVIARAKTLPQGDWEKDVYAKKGKEAFEAGFLRQNYMSGLIVKRENFIKAHMERLEIYQENTFYNTYPHEWWFAVLCFEGDYVLDCKCLIVEKESVLQEELEKIEKIGKIKEEQRGEVIENGDATAFLPAYAKYESRMEQAKGYLEFLHLMEDEKNKDEDIIKLGLQLMISKTKCMLKLAYDYGYKKEIFPNILEEYLSLYAHAIDEFQLSEENKDEVINVLVYFYMEAKKMMEK